MIYTGFMQFNMNFPMALGFNLGTQCFSSLFSNCFNNYSYQANPFTFNTTNYFSPVGFDTFSFSSGNMFNNFGFGFNSFNLAGNWNFTPTFNTGFANFSFNQTQWSSNTSSPTKKSSNKKIARKPVYSPNISNDNVRNLQWWKDQGYNPEKGVAFAKVAKEVSDQMKAAGAVSDCGGGVRRSVNKYFYNGENHYPDGWYAGLVGDKYLVNDSHFKKVTIPKGMHLDADDIPAGAIIIYHKKYSNSAASAKWGHIEVSGGNGYGYSDLTTHLLSNWGKRKEPKEIWIPI